MQRYKTWHAAADTAAAVVVATGAAWVVDDHVPTSVLALLYIAAVLLIAYRHAYRWAVAACVSTVVVLSVLFVDPRGTLRVDSQEHGLVLAALLAVSLLTAWMAHRQRSFRAAAERQSQQANALRKLAGDLSAMTASDDMLARTLDYLRTRFGRAAIAVMDPVRAAHHPSHATHTFPDSDTHLVGPSAGAPVSAPSANPYILMGDTDHTLAPDALLHCASSGTLLGAGTPRWSNLRSCYAPLRSGEHVLGALGVARSGATIADDLAALATVADILTAALVRTQHAADAAAARAQAHTQALRTTLLASVSHDLRTPLTAILGAASSLVHQRERLTPADTQRLAEHIEHEARYLARITDNTLQWLRLSDGDAAMRADWESVDDLLAAAVARFHRQSNDETLAVHCPAGLPLLQVNGVMVTQALSNLLDNALKYSPGTIRIEASRQDQRLWIEVTDQGTTLSAADRQNICETFHRLPAHASIRGTGLGLAIARAVMLAHNGALTILPRDGGGNVFRLDFPIPVQPMAPLA